MAVEIKEIVIRAVLTDTETPAEAPVQPDIDRDAIVQECIEQVLKILKKKNLR